MDTGFIRSVWSRFGICISISSISLWYKHPHSIISLHQLFQPSHLFNSTVILYLSLSLSLSVSLPYGYVKYFFRVHDSYRIYTELCSFLLSGWAVLDRQWLCQTLKEYAAWTDSFVVAACHWLINSYCLCVCVYLSSNEWIIPPSGLVTKHPAWKGNSLPGSQWRYCSAVHNTPTGT